MTCHNFGTTIRYEVNRGKALKDADGSSELSTVTAVERRMFFVRAAAAPRMTSGAEARYSTR